jgi:hypothetical protein
MIKKIFATLLIATVVLWSSLCVSQLLAGMTFYYDKDGNQISEEEYKELIKSISSTRDKQEEEKVAGEKAAEPAREDNAKNPSSEENSEGTEDDLSEATKKLSVSAETIVRVFERDAEPREDVRVIPIYEYLRVDYGDSETEGFSVHLHGWGRTDLGDGGFFEDDTDSELLYGYVEYARPSYGVNLKLGRQHVFEGVANDNVDGLRMAGALTPYFMYSAYGGFPVAFDSENGRDGDTIWGARVGNRWGAKYEVGLSYKKIDNNDDPVEEMMGIDLFAGLLSNLDFYGFSAKNLDTGDWAEHSYEARFNIKGLYIHPFYQRYRYEDFFIDDEASSNIFGFLKDTNETLSVLGGDFFWQGVKNMDLGATVKNYDYDLREETALYYSGQLTVSFGGRTQVGCDLGRMDGDTDETRYLLTRAYLYWDGIPKFLREGFLTGDVVYVYYDEEIFGKDSSLFLSLGIGGQLFTDGLTVKISGDYSDDPFFDEDVRGMLVIIYRYQ